MVKRFSICEQVVLYYLGLTFHVIDEITDKRDNIDG